jgi:hypothetical protein
MNLEWNLKLIKTLDNAWNSQDGDTFNKRHADEIAVYWPGQLKPTRGRSNHKSESIEFFKTFPDNHMENDPYKILLGQVTGLVLLPILQGRLKGL